MLMFMGWNQRARTECDTRCHVAEGERSFRLFFSRIFFGRQLWMPMDGEKRGRERGERERKRGREGERERERDEERDRERER
eukprot:1392997-Amorphochlora_amoeboformis.AAC.1